MIYKRGQKIIGTITKVVDDPRRGISYTITSGTESFACSDFHNTNFTLHTVEICDPFEEHMNPPEEKEEELYRIHIEADSDAYDYEDVKDIYIEDGFLCMNVINKRKFAIKLDDVIHYVIEPQIKEGEGEREL